MRFHRFFTRMVCALGAFLLIAGCVTEPSDGDVTGDVPDSAGDVGEEGIPDVSVFAAPGTDWDDVLDQIDVDSLREKERESTYRMLELDGIHERPEVEVVREITFLESPTVLVACLNEAGFAAVEDSGGVLFPTDLAGDQRPLYLAFGICKLKYPVDPFQRIPLPRVRAELLYDYQTGELLECLQVYGAEVGVTRFTEPPSLQVWLDAHYQFEEVWNPFVPFQANPDNSVPTTAYQRCPQWPEGLYP